MSEKDTSEIRFELDPNNLPRMAEADMAALTAMKDEEIDYSDTPPLMGSPTRRIFGPRFGNLRDVIALEPDVVDFFKESGDVTPDRINAVLREYVETHRKRA